jgi:AraC-like DNA-binding protein
MERLGNIDYLTDWLAIRRQKIQLTTPMHDHPLTELVVVMSGRCQHLLEDDAFPVGAGDVFVIPPGVCHGYAETENLVILNVMFDLDAAGIPHLDLDGLPGYHALFTFEPRLRREKRFGARLQLSMSRIAELDQLAAGIEREALHPGPGSQFAAAGLLMQVIVGLSRDYSRQERAESLSMLRLGDVLIHLEKHHHEAIAVEELAHLANMSERSLYRAFQTALGCSPLEYTLTLRLRHASDLLRTTDLRLGEIAKRTGFSDGGYLSRQFRKRYRLSPTEYRRSRSGHKRH